MEFENLQIEVPTGDNAPSSYLGIKVYEKRYHNTSKGFVIGFDPNSKEYIERKQRRAKRFGCKHIEVITAEKENERMSDTDRFKKIDIKTLIWPSVPDEANDEIRDDAILLYGVEHMSTNDVFEYFKLFGPETIEWIDDYSCNVVWDDKATVINALDSLSKTFGTLLELQRKAAAADNPTQASNIPVVPLIIKEEEEDEEITCYENQVVVEDEQEVDPKDIWRIGIPFKENQLFLRYATKQDRKLPGAAQRSEYYLKYGKNPENTKSGVAGVLSNSRKRKLQQMQKLAVERFKTKEPDVKIVALAELKAEGIISKMEVDEDEEPIVKRLNVDSHERIAMTMVADKVEVQQRLGDRYAADTVHDRLGTPLPGDNKDDRTVGIHDRLGVISLDGIGRRNNNEQMDARDEIHNTRCTHHNNQTYVSGHGYVDDFGDYHDIYRASDLKSEAEDDKEDFGKGVLEVQLYNHNDEHRNIYESDNESINRSQSSIRNRLGTSREGVTTPVSDLRDKLRRQGKSKYQAVQESLEENIKDENDGEKVNLCIEIKQEPQVPCPDVPMDDEEEEFEF